MAQRTWPWLLVTALLGTGYLVALGQAWHTLGTQGVRFTASPDGAFFFILTGSHAAHVLAGLALLIAGIGGLYRLRRVEQRQILIDCIAWFWHAMAAFWLLLFTLLVLTR